jgi:hypothetical protein
VAALSISIILDINITTGFESLAMKYAPNHQSVDYAQSHNHQDGADEEAVILIHRLPNNRGVMIESYAAHEAEARNIRGSRKSYDYQDD